MAGGTVFILGAGASVTSGAPTTAEFLYRAEDVRAAGLPDGYRADFDLFFRGYEELAALGGKARLKQPTNIETILSAFEMAAQVGRLGALTAPEDLERLVPASCRVIAHTLSQLVRFPVGAKDVRPTNAYRAFVDKLLPLLEGDSSRAAVITFNYDLALDYALYYANVPISYGFAEEAATSKLSLLKLHGSLNWGRCAACGGIVAVSLSEYFKRFRWMEQRGLRPAETTTLNLPDHLREFSHESHGPLADAPVIVPPTQNKLAHHEPLASVWRSAADKIGKARSVVVIGYSLPETDLFFRYLYSIGSATGTIVRKFWLCDPQGTAGVGDRFRALLGDAVLERFHIEAREFPHVLDHLPWGEF